VPNLYYSSYLNKRRIKLFFDIIVEMRFFRIIMELRDKSKVFLNTLIITGSVVVEKVLFFVINMIIARYLNIQHYGEYTTALSFATFFSMFTDLGINDALIRELNYEKEKSYTLFNVILLKTVVSIVLFIFFLIASSLTGYTHEVLYLILIFGLVRFGDEYLRVYYTYYEGTSRYFLSALFRLLFAFLFLVAVLFVVMFSAGNREIAWSRLFVVVFFILLISFTELKNKLKTINLIYIRQFYHNTLPFALAFVSSLIIGHGSLIILPLIHGTIYTGLFQNAYIFLTTLIFIPASFGRVFIPYLYKHKHDEDVEKFQFAFNIITKSYVVVSFYIAIILFIYADFIIVTIFGDKYTGSILLLKILSFGIPFLFNAAIIIITALDKQKLYSRVLKYIAILSLVLNIILSYFFKDAGASAATVLIFIIIFIASNILIKKTTNLKINNSITNYSVGILIFLICYLAHEYLCINNNLLAIVATTVLYGFLNMILLFNRNDLRIAKEIVRNSI